MDNDTDVFKQPELLEDPCFFVTSQIELNAPSSKDVRFYPIMSLKSLLDDKANCVKGNYLYKMELFVDKEDDTCFCVGAWMHTSNCWVLFDINSIPSYVLTSPNLLDLSTRGNGRQTDFSSDLERGQALMSNAYSHLFLGSIIREYFRCGYDEDSTYNIGFKMRGITEDDAKLIYQAVFDYCPFLDIITILNRIHIPRSLLFYPSEAK